MSYFLNPECIVLSIKPVITFKKIQLLHRIECVFIFLVEIFPDFYPLEHNT